MLMCIKYYIYLGLVKKFYKQIAYTSSTLHLIELSVVKLFTNYFNRSFNDKLNKSNNKLAAFFDC